MGPDEPLCVTFTFIQEESFLHEHAQPLNKRFAWRPTTGSAYDVPRRKLSKHEIKLSTKPWITKHVFAKIRYRDKLYSKIIRYKHSNPNLMYLHKKFKDVKASKFGYFKNYFLCNNNMKKIWSGIRSIINVNKVKADYIPSILGSGKTVENPCAIANILNSLFVNVGTVAQPLF